MSIVKAVPPPSRFRVENKRLRDRAAKARRRIAPDVDIRVDVEAILHRHELVRHEREGLLGGRAEADERRAGDEGGDVGRDGRDDAAEEGEDGPADQEPAAAVVEGWLGGSDKGEREGVGTDPKISLSLPTRRRPIERVRVYTKETQTMLGSVVF